MIERIHIHIHIHLPICPTQLFHFISFHLNKPQFHSQDLHVPFKAQPRYLDRLGGEGGGGKEDAGEVYEGAEYDAKNGLVNFDRYCHVYKEGELAELATQVEGLEVLESGWDSGNHYVRLRRVS